MYEDRTWLDPIETPTVVRTRKESLLALVLPDWSFTRLCRVWHPAWHAVPQVCIPEGSLSHTRNGRHSACLMSCGWYSCHSSSADHGLAFHNSSWACSFSCPISLPPLWKRKGPINTPSMHLLKQNYKCLWTCNLEEQIFFIFFVFSTIAFETNHSDFLEN